MPPLSPPEQPVAYLCVFNRAETDTTKLDPPEPLPARFATQDEAQATVESYATWNRRGQWSIFTNAIPPYIIADGASRPNPDWQAAQWECRIVTNPDHAPTPSR